MSKPSIPKGTRDFGPDVMVRRNFIFNTIRTVFERHGFLPIETPAMENLSTLTGKYGEEGDQLIFKILNNGDFLLKADEAAMEERNSKKLSFSISKKALRYDLTVPFARFVVMNQNDIAFPFKRYQIQPVWRGDRPGKGRYQEFFQCDADIIGSDSLLNEVELVQIFDEVLSGLDLPGFEIRINNRKILAGIAEIVGVGEHLTNLTVAIDKLDKIGKEGVEKELRERSFTETQIQQLEPMFSLEGSNEEILTKLETWLGDSDIAMEGIRELSDVISKVDKLGLQKGRLVLNVTLARGLNYYTGAIFEVVADNVQIGSICGGGRYDDLTGIFGLNGMSGVGISFGADRIYDVMEALDLFPENTSNTTQLLFINFGEQEADYCLGISKNVRAQGINTEVYPDAAKMKKQMKYANDKRIPFVVLIGENEMNSGNISVKNMITGDQSEMPVGDLASFISR